MSRAQPDLVRDAPPARRGEHSDKPRRRSLRGSIAAVLVTSVAVAHGGCTIATEYVPQTPGRATVGMRDREIGVYKNGTFTPLSGDVSTVLGCSPQVVASATAAAARRRDYRINNWISVVGFDVVVLSPLTGVVALWIAGAGIGATVASVFGVRAVNAERASYALTVDAINRHNDTAACLAAPPPVAGGQP